MLCPCGIALGAGVRAARADIEYCSLALNLSAQRECYSTNWAPGDARIEFPNSDYNFWTANGQNATSPGFGSFPVVDTPEFAKFSMTMPGGGWRTAEGENTKQGFEGAYWNSTPYSSTVGHRFCFYNSFADPARGTWGTYPHGMSIRCVRP